MSSSLEAANVALFIKGVCRHSDIADFEISRLSYMTPVAPTLSHERHALTTGTGEQEPGPEGQPEKVGSTFSTELLLTTQVHTQHSDTDLGLGPPES